MCAFDQKLVSARQEEEPDQERTTRTGFQTCRLNDGRGAGGEQPADIQLRDGDRHTLGLKIGQDKQMESL